MTNDTMNEADMATGTDDVSEAAEAADAADEIAVLDDEVAVVADVPPNRSRSPWVWVSAALLVALIAAGGFGYFKYEAAADDLASMRQADADRATAAQMAKDYAMKSLTYSFEDPDAFFKTVEDGVSQALKDKYVNASDLLKGVMLQAQVTSTGEVLATEAISQPGGVYQVVVSASQTTRNLQNPEPRVSIILLQITVNKVGDTWQISDIGPKTGSQAANAEQVPTPKPGTAPVPPAPPKR
jgi:Mce-associated membrane protein